jgi:hypothetical protein
VSDGDADPVTWGRFAESQRRLDERFRQIEEQFTLLTDTLSKRKDRSWQLVTVVLTGILVPLIVTGALALIHHLKVV